MSVMIEQTKYIIYGLADPRNNELRYIGQSSKGLKRPRQHWSTSAMKLKDHCHNWINCLINKKVIPDIMILDEFDGDENNIEAVKSWLDTSEILAISFYREQGCNLTNLTDGGAGSLGRVHSKKTKRLIREARLRQGNPRLGTGKPLIEVTCKYCLKAFKTKRRNQLYCNRDCYSANDRSTDIRINMSLSSSKRKEIICIEDGTKYPSEHTLARTLCINRSKVSYAIKNNKNINGKHYQYTFAQTQPKIKCVDDELTFNSVKEAENHYKIDYRYILRVCRGAQKTTQGLMFEFIGE